MSTASRRRGPSSNIPGHSLFKKATSSKDFNFHTKRQASRFAEMLRDCPEGAKPELLLLFSRGKYSLERLLDLIEWCSTPCDFDSLVIPALQFFQSPVFSGGMYRDPATRFLRGIFLAPFFPEFLDKVVENLTIESKNVVCGFLVCVTRGLLEARGSETVKSIARKLDDAEDVRNVEQLKRLLFVSADTSVMQTGIVCKTASMSSEAVLAWGSELKPPGERHDNDFLDFRSISLVPTTAELLCEIPPYLPLGEQNRFLNQDLHLQHALDAHFRLLREDVVLAAREKIGSGPTLTGLRLVAIDSAVSDRSHPSFVFAFQAPGPSFTTGKKEARRKKWDQFRGLNRNDLVCIARKGKPLWCGTLIRTDIEKWLMHASGPRIGIHFELNSVGLQAVLELVGSDVELEMITLSRNFFSYQPILQRLQDMESLSFESELLHGANDESTAMVMKDYKNVVLPECFGGICVDVSTPEHAKQTESALKESTSLDEWQASAFATALRRRVAVIQGPPGTGKSFIGVALASTLLENSSAKIAVLTYTNHALDEFLLDILEKDVTRDIVRMGGRSRTAGLDQHNLFELARRQRLPGSFHNEFYTLKMRLTTIEEELETTARACKEFRLTWGDELKSWLEDDSFASRELLDSIEQGASTKDDGFRILGSGGKKAVTEIDLFDWWKKGASRPGDAGAGTSATGNNAKNVWSWSLDRRQEFLKRCKTGMVAEIKERLSNSYKDLVEAKREMTSLQKESQRQVVNSARIVGATTSGAAIHANVFAAFNPDVVIVEEAGEVLEAHILANLWEAKQMILIGDHEQLRPKVETYDLTIAAGKGYSLDMSLFERLVLHTDLPLKTLRLQHRMRPEISQLVRVQTYPNLKDAQGVEEYPSVRGIDSNVLFIDHDFPEDQLRGAGSVTKTSAWNQQISRSKTNAVEAQLAVGVCRYILQQGQINAAPEDIVILTPYLGQMKVLVSEVSKRLKDVTAVISQLDAEDLADEDGGDYRQWTSTNERAVKVSTIDNFQGEEAKVVVVSLVRSNPSGAIGFLNQAQRVNVLLSRAKWGMYLLGNSTTLLHTQKGAKVWSPVLDMLEDQGRVLDGLPVHCTTHTDDAAVLRTPDDFRNLRLNGGCERKCKNRLQCGHECNLQCHSGFDPLHKRIACDKPCQRFPPDCPSEHPCSKLCKDNCGDCEVLVDVVLPLCGHAGTVTCATASDAARLKAAYCHVQVDKKLECDHLAVVDCSVLTGKDDIMCKESCNEKLLCGHNCAGNCHVLCLPGGHKTCDLKCGKLLLCGHSCEMACHSSGEDLDCGPCQKACPVQCVHSKCVEKCSNSCPPCLEPCTWECEHEGKCTHPCSAPCSRLPCEKRCEKTLDCRHQCPSVCGETCPTTDACQECGSLLDSVVDFITFAKYSEVDLDEDPVIQLHCGHLFVRSTMDGHFGLDSAYSRNVDGKWEQLLTPPGGTPMSCPSCRQVISSVYRYGRCIRFAELQALEKRFLNDANRLFENAKLELDSNEPRKAYKTLRRVLKNLVKNSPTRKLYQASGGAAGRDESLLSVPPSEPVVRTTLAMVRAATGIFKSEYKTSSQSEGEGASSQSDGKSEAQTTHGKVDSLASVQPIYKEVMAAVQWSVGICEKHNSNKSGGDLRISFAAFFLERYPLYHMRPRDETATVSKYLAWVTESEFNSVSQDVKDVALLLQSRVDSKGLTEEELLSIEIALGSLHISGFRSGSGRWHRCSNGHSTFIGDCEAAVETSVCLECGGPVSEHTGLVSIGAEAMPTHRDFLNSLPLRAAAVCGIVRSGIASAGLAGGSLNDATNFDSCLRFLNLCMEWKRDRSRETEFRIVFHGTNAVNIPSIIDQSLRVPDGASLSVRHGSSFGKGIYVSTKPQLALLYSDNKRVFACLMNPGKVRSARRGSDPQTAGCDTFQGHLQGTEIFVLQSSDQVLPCVSVDSNALQQAVPLLKKVVDFLKQNS